MTQVLDTPRRKPKRYMEGLRLRYSSATAEGA